VLDRVTGNDPLITDYIMVECVGEVPAVQARDQREDACGASLISLRPDFFGFFERSRPNARLEIAGTFFAIEDVDVLWQFQSFNA
jgi:hypothetical protein